MKALLIAAALTAMDETPKLHTTYVPETVCQRCEQFAFRPLTVQFPSIHNRHEDFPIDKKFETPIDHPLITQFFDQYNEKVIPFVLHKEDEYMFYKNTHHLWTTMVHGFYSEHTMSRAFLNNDYFMFEMNYNGTVTYTIPGETIPGPGKFTDDYY